MTERGPNDKSAIRQPAMTMADGGRTDFRAGMVAWLISDFRFFFARPVAPSSH
jgi:hypothetical protein